MALTRNLKIPDELDASIEHLVHLGDSDFEQLVSVLGEVQPSVNRSVFATRVSARFVGDSERIKNMVQFLITLYVVRESTKIDDLLFVEDVCSSIEAKNKPALRPVNENWDAFKDKLRQLMSFDSTVGITAKAYDVMSQHERFYCAGSRITTDIRPVFSKNMEDKPTAALIIHTLKLCYHTGDTTEDIFVALDSDDIKQLRELLDRAEAKASTLHTVLDDAKMQYLGEGR